MKEYFQKIRKNTFSWASLKLSLFYVGIVMIISIGFSLAIYNISSSEIDRGLGRQTRVLQDLRSNSPMAGPMQDLEQVRAAQLDETSRNLAIDLIYFNLLILALSSFVSYYLARLTLNPIEAAHEAQNRFTADASHELRTPLTAMKSEVEVALRDKKMTLSDARKLLESNLEEVDKLESLANSLLKLAREPESIRDKFELVSLEEAVTEAYEKVEPLANKKSIEFETELKDIKVMGNHQSLTELFVILLDNAIKYSPEKSKISVVIEKEKDNAVIKIVDQGAGIKASDLPYIFNRFYRADTSRSRENVAGYGLGLSIAKQIVDLHDGEISATSKVGKGSEFTVKFGLK